MITNKQGSSIKEHTNIFFGDEYPHYYISNFDLGSISKNKYLNYINLLGIDCSYRVYHTMYWVGKRI